MIVICRLPTDVDVTVNSRRSANDSAARVKENATADRIIWFGLKAPVVPRITDCLDVSNRDFYPWARIRWSCLHKKNFYIGPCAEAVGQYATCGTRADDDVVKLSNL